MLTVSSALFAGIDAGGSHCRVRLEDETGTLLGEGRSGAANLGLGWPQVEANICQALNAALQQAGLNSSAYARLHVGAGFAGAHLAGLKATALQWQHPFASWHVTTDLHAACYGAHGGEAGSVIILGTGFSAIGLTEHGETLLGGYGFPINAVCSGAGLGLQAVQAVLLALDALAPATVLTVLLQRHFNGGAALMAEQLLQATPQQYAELAPLVFQAADSGDAVALAMLQQAFNFISRLNQQLPPGRCCLLGGVGQRLLTYLPQTQRSRFSAPLAPATVGAIYYARRQLAVAAQEAAQDGAN
ncbi:glucosamine kinase [Rheinheimera pacifica]|uniref:Glucosamine kinase n=1 Tax=Rheinheimera pacifica TaxID=173990 RepID=A0A1H6J5X8_9GAMM|nr:BadF/BadG/BcrA/BcrD ATPase family protein [Rheinheimera pacifica]SEH55689.1 glucosamine kinase [Rheinheimera pacifica]